MKEKLYTYAECVKIKRKIKDKVTIKPSKKTDLQRFEFKWNSYEKMFVGDWSGNSLSWYYSARELYHIFTKRCWEVYRNGKRV